MYNIRNNFAQRQMFLIGVFLSQLAKSLSTFSENIGHLFFHLTSRNGHIGYIDIDVQNDEADGLIRARVRNDFGQIELHEQPFRISNRWYMRHRKAMTSRALWQIRTDANIIHGLDVHSIVLGNYCHNRREIKPFDLSRLPSDEVIAARHARMKRVQDFLGRLFPARAPANGLSREEIAELIVKRI